MSTTRILARVFSRRLESGWNTTFHQRVKTNLFPACRRSCSYTNTCTNNGLNPMNLLTRLKGLYRVYVHTWPKVSNPSCSHCSRIIRLPVICVNSSGSLCLLYWVQKCFKNMTFQAFCSEFDTSDSISKSQPVHKQNVFMLIEKLIMNLCGIVQLCFRAFRLCLTFLPVLFLYPFAIFSHSFKALWWDIFLFAVEISGPAFIKLGQWASTRRDLFTDEFCDKFSVLHHHARSHSWKHTVFKMEQAYGKNWRDIFVIFENNAEPVGSGCVAQVYKAYIREEQLPKMFQDKLLQDRLLEVYLEDQTSYAEGIEISSWEDELEDENSIFHDEDNLFIPSEPKSSGIPDHIVIDTLIPVAVKVLHPNVHEVFNRDLALMHIMSQVLQTIVPSLRWVSLVECVEEFSISMKKQMNMINEAKCLERFSKDFSMNASVRIPRPIWPLVRMDVLVETFEEGEPISKFLKEDEDLPSGLREKLAELGVDALIQMVFVNNFVHGDLHPGNILVQGFEEFKEKVDEKLVLFDVFDTMMSAFVEAASPVRLVFLDCGITASLSKDDLQKFTEVFTAVVKGEGETVAKLFLQKTSVMHCKDEKQFIKEMAAVVNKARGASINLSQIDVAELLSEVFGVLAKHHVKMESNFATVILAIAVLEGLGRSLDPNIDILEKAKPVLLHKMFS